MPSTIAAFVIAATMTGAVPAPPQPVAPDQSVSATALQTAPLPFPGARFPEAPGRRTPIVILPPRVPLIFLPRPPVVHRQLTGYKGAIIGALVGGGVGALVGVTHFPDLTRGGAAFLGAFALGVPGGVLGHQFDFK